MSRKIITRLAAWVFMFAICPNPAALAQQKDFDTIGNRITSEMHSRINFERNDRQVDAFLKDLRNDGTWPDINYLDKSRTVWAPANHLRRVQQFALAYGQRGGQYYHDPVLHQAIIDALSAWDQNNPLCANWWYNEIACPQLLGQILLLLKSDGPLPAPLNASLIQKMVRGNMEKETGANKFDIALHTLYRAILISDQQLLTQAIQQCFKPIQLTTKPEGIQYDYTYFQHGPQLQIASYGGVFVTGEYRVASYVCGTRWQMPQSQWQILNNYLNKTFLNAIRYKFWDFNVMGRGFSRKDSGMNSTLESLKYNMSVLKNYIKKDDFQPYEDAISRISGKVPASYHLRSIHRQYWQGDYTLHTNEAFLFTLRSNSLHANRTETGNGENLYGRYMSDGATNIQRRGDEYFNIFPLWEYDKVPGVTCRQFAADQPANNAWVQPGTTNFTGGVGGGSYGVSTYTLNFDSLSAKKSWFFFDNRIICLGAGINSTTAEPITTSVNQCWSRGELAISSAQNRYWQDSIAYYFLPGEKVRFTNSVLTGSWRHINSAQSVDTVKGKVFKIWINHGEHPDGATYAYAVVPGAPVEDQSTNSPFLTLNIIGNNDKYQAVYDSQKQILQAVFYESGRIKTGQRNVQTDQPCVLMIKKLASKHPEIFVADPTHLLKKINISIDGLKINCRLPSKAYAGATFHGGVR